MAARQRGRSAVPGTTQVDKAVKESGIPMQVAEDTAHPVETLDSLQPVAKVRVGGSVTQNMGNYNSIRVEVSVEIPCMVEDIEATYGRASEFVDEKLQQELDLAKGVDTDGNATTG